MPFDVTNITVSNNMLSDDSTKLKELIKQQMGYTNHPVNPICSNCEFSTMKDENNCGGGIMRCELNKAVTFQVPYTAGCDFFSPDEDKIKAEKV